MSEKNQQATTTSASVPLCTLAVDPIIYASMDGVQSTFLPEDIIVDEILPRLPIKPLFKFMCVSKRYKSIISVPKFGQSYLQQAYSSPESLSSSGLLSLSLLLFPFTDLSFNEYIKDLTEAITDSCDRGSIRLSCVSPPNDHESHTIMGSSNGLILSVFHPPGCSNFSLCVSNPLTKQCVQLPNPTTLFRLSELEFCIATKGEQDASAFLTYKIVIIRRVLLRFYPDGADGYTNTIVEIFSSDSGSWAAWELIFPLGVLYRCTYRAGFAYKGILYWLNHRDGSVVAYDPFDRYTTGFERIQLPERKYSDSCLINSGDQEMLKYYGIEDGYPSDTLWVWQLVDSDKGEWCLEHKFVIQSLPRKIMKLMVAPNPWNRQLICNPYAFCYPSLLVFNLGERSWEYVRVFQGTDVEKTILRGRRMSPLIPIVLCPWSSPFYPQS